MICIDSDVLIEIIDHKSIKGSEAFKQLLASGEDYCTTSISMHEVLFGIHKYNKSSTDLMQLSVLDYTRNDSILSSKLEVEAQQAGTPVGRTDSMIAAIAINNDVTLFTFDLKHFEPLKKHGLKLFR
ncbi:MAG: type II toxin-antitoxin system VapC family toxin [Betaproteobacteria bacterium]